MNNNAHTYTESKQIKRRNSENGLFSYTFLLGTSSSFKKEIICILYMFVSSGIQCTYKCVCLHIQIYTHTSVGYMCVNIPLCVCFQRFHGQTQWALGRLLVTDWHQTSVSPFTFGTPASLLSHPLVSVIFDDSKAGDGIKHESSCLCLVERWFYNKYQNLKCTWFCL